MSGKTLSHIIIIVSCALVACTMVFFTKKDDTPVEEVLEEVVEDMIELELQLPPNTLEGKIDFTPSSKEEEKEV